MYKMIKAKNDPEKKWLDKFVGVVDCDTNTFYLAKGAKGSDVKLLPSAKNIVAEFSNYKQLNIKDGAFKICYNFDHTYQLCVDYDSFKNKDKAVEIFAFLQEQKDEIAPLVPAIHVKIENFEELYFKLKEKGIEKYNIVNSGKDGSWSVYFNLKPLKYSDCGVIPILERNGELLNIPFLIVLYFKKVMADIRDDGRYVSIGRFCAYGSKPDPTFFQKFNFSQILIALQEDAEKNDVFKVINSDKNLDRFLTSSGIYVRTLSDNNYELYIFPSYKNQKAYLNTDSVNRLYLTDLYNIETSTPVLYIKYKHINMYDENERIKVINYLDQHPVEVIGNTDEDGIEFLLTRDRKEIKYITETPFVTHFQREQTALRIIDHFIDSADKAMLKKGYRHYLTINNGKLSFEYRYENPQELELSTGDPLVDNGVFFSINLKKTTIEDTHFFLNFWKEYTADNINLPLNHWTFTYNFDYMYINNVNLFNKYYSIMDNSHIFGLKKEGKTLSVKALAKYDYVMPKVEEIAEKMKKYFLNGEITKFVVSDKVEFKKGEVIDNKDICHLGYLKIMNYFGMKLTNNACDYKTRSISCIDNFLKYDVLTCDTKQQLFNLIGTKCPIRQRDKQIAFYGEVNNCSYLKPHLDVYLDALNKFVDKYVAQISKRYGITKEVDRTAINEAIIKSGVENGFKFKVDNLFHLFYPEQNADGRPLKFKNNEVYEFNPATVVDCENVAVGDLPEFGDVYYHDEYYNSDADVTINVSFDVTKNGTTSSKYVTISNGVATFEFFGDCPDDSSDDSSDDKSYHFIRKIDLLTGKTIYEKFDGCDCQHEISASVVLPKTDGNNAYKEGYNIVLKEVSLTEKDEYDEAEYELRVIEKYKDGDKWKTRDVTDTDIGKKILSNATIDGFNIIPKGE